VSESNRELTFASQKAWGSFSTSFHDQIDQRLDIAMGIVEKMHCVGKGAAE
jgi:hypothetical protein